MTDGPADAPAEPAASPDNGHEAGSAGAPAVGRLTDHTVEISPADVVAAQPHIQRILEGRSPAFRGWADGPPIVDRAAFRMLRVLAPLGLVLGVFLLVLKREELSADWTAAGLWVAIVVFFGSVAWAAYRLSPERLYEERLRLAGHVLAFNARRIVKGTARRAPFRVSYRFEGAAYAATVEFLNQAVTKRRKVTVQPERVRVVVFDGPLCCLYRRRWSQSWFAVLWLQSDEVRAAVDAYVERLCAERPEVEVVRQIEPQPRIAI